MSIFGKIIPNNAERIAKGQLTARFDGWQKMGAITREADTRTTKELLGNIDYFAERIPEVAHFQKELKTMNSKHLGLVSDICELGSKKAMLTDELNLREIKNNGKNVLQLLLEKLPKASKENPEALEFTKEIINHTDARASKVFLARNYGILDCPQAAKHMTATKPLVKDIAESTLSGGYTMDYKKENAFVDAIQSYVNPSVKPENIEIISESIKVADNLPKDMKLDCVIDAHTILESKTSPQQMRKNLEIFSQIAEGLSQKTSEVNLSDFVTRNVNLD